MTEFKTLPAPFANIKSSKDGKFFLGNNMDNPIPIVNGGLKVGEDLATSHMDVNKIYVFLWSDAYTSTRINRIVHSGVLTDIFIEREVVIQKLDPIFRVEHLDHKFSFKGDTYPNELGNMALVRRDIGDVTLLKVLTDEYVGQGYHVGEVNKEYGLTIMEIPEASDYHVQVVVNLLTGEYPEIEIVDGEVYQKLLRIRTRADGKLEEVVFWLSPINYVSNVLDGSIKITSELNKEITC